MQNLALHVPQIIQLGDVDKGDAYQEIFIEIGKGNIETIVQNCELEILNILLELMGMGCIKEDQLSESGFQKI